MKAKNIQILQDSFIPNSVAHKKSDRNKAIEALAKAKSIPREVRRALSHECEFWRELQTRTSPEPKEIRKREDGLISAAEAQKLFNISQFTINIKRTSGILAFIKEGRKFFYRPEDIEKLSVRKYKI